MQTTKCLSRIYLNFYHHINYFNMNFEWICRIFKWYTFWLQVMFLFSLQLYYSLNIVERYLPSNWGQIFIHLKNSFLRNFPGLVFFFFAFSEVKFRENIFTSSFPFQNRYEMVSLVEIVETPPPLFKWFPFTPCPAGIIEIERKKEKGDWLHQYCFLFPLYTLHHVLKLLKLEEIIFRRKILFKSKPGACFLEIGRVQY